MKREIEFTRDTANEKFMEIYRSFERSEQSFAAGDRHRNIFNTCRYSEAVRSLKIFGAEVDSTGIYDDKGYNRIGYGKINNPVFIKNGEFNFDELRAALWEIADQE